MIIKACYMDYDDCSFNSSVSEPVSFYGVFPEDLSHDPEEWVAAFKEQSDAEDFLRSKTPSQQCAENY